MLLCSDQKNFLTLLFAEIRTHGVGYYQFAKDEETRKEQMEDLSKLREEVIKYPL